MNQTIVGHEVGRRAVAAKGVALLGWVLMVTGLAACQPPASPSPPPALVEPAIFATWPRVTERPIRVSSGVWLMCRLPTPDETRAREAEAERYGPHFGHSIVVRVSPDAIDAYREGRPLPHGAVVVKEKYETYA